MATTEQEAIERTNCVDEKEWRELKHEVLAQIAEEIETPTVGRARLLHHTVITKTGERLPVVTWWD